MKSILLIFLMVISSVAKVNGNTFELTPRCKNAFELVFELQFAEAEKILAEEKKASPSNAAVHYVQNYMDFLRAFISEQEGDFSRLKKNSELQLKEIDKIDSKNPWKNLAKGEIMLRSSIVKLKWKEYFSSGYYLRKSYKVLEENHKSFPDFTPNQKSLGFLHAIIGSVPENYKWLANLAGMRGTISQGSGELSKVMRFIEKNPSFSFMSDEVMFLKIFIATHLEKKPDAAIELLKKYKSSYNHKGPLYTFIESNTLMSAGRYDDAIDVLNKYQHPAASYPLHYLHYMKGMLLMNKLDSGATVCFRKYVDQYKGNSFVKSAWHKIAWMKLIEGDEKSFHHHMEMVIKAGNDFTDEDKQALKEAQSKEIPNVILLKSRLLFDGGNYNGALAEIAGKPVSSFPRLKDQIEFTYRLARIFDKKGQSDKAIQYYTSTYENGKNLEWYFAANAALLTGNIYETNGDKKSAAEWYKKCLALRNHEYQNSIDQKAEAGLNRLEL